MTSPSRGAEFQALNFNNKLCYHRVGTPQSADVLVYWRPEHPEWRYAGAVSDDGRYLVISVSVGTDERNRILVRDLAEPYAMPVELIDNFEHEYTFVGNDGPVLFFKTDLDAPRRRLVAIDLRQAQAGRLAGNHPPERGHADPGELGRRSLHRLLSEGRRLAGQGVLPRRPVRPRRSTCRASAPPPASAANGPTRRPSTASPASPRRRASTTTTWPPATSRLWRRAEVKFKPDDYEVKQVFYRSKDGTRVPMFVAYKKGIQLDGSNPTLLYGYGGFNISLLPMFSISRVAWMEMGGVYAQPNLRGGGEYGEAWHEAGTKLKKQNVFDDFIAAAEWLIAEKYTRPDKLAIQGGSNGGLLVGAVDDPAARPVRGLPAGRGRDGHAPLPASSPKAGCGSTTTDRPTTPQQFKALLAYSPYHNIKPGTCYPATLVTTADTDDRVVPGHSFKFAAALQHAQAGDAPGADPHFHPRRPRRRESRSASGSRKWPTTGRSW